MIAGGSRTGIIDDEGAKVIEIGGKKYKVTENLGFQGGYQARMVEDNGKERAAVKRNGRWTWWTAEDRLDRRLTIGGYYDSV